MLAPRPRPAEVSIFEDLSGYAPAYMQRRNTASPTDLMAGTVIHMPITVDLEKSPLLKGMVEHVRKECTVENIMIVLHARFGRPPNTEAADALAGRVDKIVVQSATAATFEEAIMVPLISSVGEDGTGARTGNGQRDG